MYAVFFSVSSHQHFPVSFHYLVCILPVFCSNCSVCNQGLSSRFINTCSVFCQYFQSVFSKVSVFDHSVGVWGSSYVRSICAASVQCISIYFQYFEHSVHWDFRSLSLFFSQFPVLFQCVLSSWASVLFSGGCRCFINVFLFFVCSIVLAVCFRYIEKWLTDSVNKTHCGGDVPHTLFFSVILSMNASVIFGEIVSKFSVAFFGIFPTHFQHVSIICSYFQHLFTTFSLYILYISLIVFQRLFSMLSAFSVVFNIYALFFLCVSRFQEVFNDSASNWSDPLCIF